MVHGCAPVGISAKEGVTRSPPPFTPRNKNTKSSSNSHALPYPLLTTLHFFLQPLSFIRIIPMTRTPVTMASFIQEAMPLRPGKKQGPRLVSRASKCEPRCRSSPPKGQQKRKGQTGAPTSPATLLASPRSRATLLPSLTLSSTSRFSRLSRLAR